MSTLTVQNLTSDKASLRGLCVGIAALCTPLALAGLEVVAGLCATEVAPRLGGAWVGAAVELTVRLALVDAVLLRVAVLLVVVADACAEAARLHVPRTLMS